MAEQMAARVLRAEGAEMRAQAEIGDCARLNPAPGDLEAAEQHEAASTQQIALDAAQPGAEGGEKEILRVDVAHGAAGRLMAGDGGIDLGQFSGTEGFDPIGPPVHLRPIPRRRAADRPFCELHRVSSVCLAVSLSRFRGAVQQDQP